MRKTNILLIVLAFTFIICSSLNSTSHSKYYVNNDLVKVDVLIGNEKYIAYNYYHDMNYFVEADLGERYTIRIHNKHSRRIAVVVSVDGRDVITGNKAKLKFGASYVIDPYSYIDIPGFRKSMQEVATFRFSTPSKSYSMRMASPAEKADAYARLGAIGIAVFVEKAEYFAYGYEDDEYVPHKSDYKNKKDRGAAPAPSVSEYALKEESKVGTEYGESRTDRVDVTDFEPQTTFPEQVMVIYYNTRDGLYNWGVPVRYYNGSNTLPEYPFAPPPRD